MNFPDYYADKLELSSSFPELLSEEEQITWISEVLGKITENGEWYIQSSYLLQEFFGWILI